MPSVVTGRYLDPAVLAQVSNLELIARTVVDGFVAGLHRSPDFGFSQEFAEYRAYTPGDDLRHVDWNVYARTERAYLKRYRGETNTTVSILLDVSGSMSFGAPPLRKLDYARYLASSLAYLAHLQRDSSGLIVFADDVQALVPPSSRQGQLNRMLHAIDAAQPGVRTDFTKPFTKLQELIKRRALTVLISDFYEDPETLIRHLEPLRHRGSELVLFHILHPQEINPDLGSSPLLLDMETGDALETSPEYGHSEYQEKMQAHLASLQSKARGSGLDYFLLRTDRPLDSALREYFRLRERRF